MATDPDMTDPAPPGLSRSVEDYLKAVYGLTGTRGAGGGETAATSALATALDVQPASVTGMVKRLAEAGLLEHVPYRGVRLTEEGEREALRVIRRHRILETYLLKRLGYSWDDVHDEAERLEHAASDRLVERMARALEDPSHDPHGAPIPTRAGEIEEVDLASLADAVEGEAVRIRSVDDEDGDRLRWMASRGLKPGVRLRVEGRGDERDAVRVGAPDGRTHLVSGELARRIWVTVEE